MTESEISEITALIHTGQIYQLPKDQLHQLVIKMNSPRSVSGFGVSEREGFIKIIENAIQSSKVPNPDRITTEKKNWQSNPLYYIAVGVIIVMLGAFLIYLTRKHLGVSL